MRWVIAAGVRPIYAAGVRTPWCGMARRSDTSHVGVRAHRGLLLRVLEQIEQPGIFFSELRPNGFREVGQRLERLSCLLGGAQPQPL